MRTHKTSGGASSNAQKASSTDISTNHHTKRRKQGPSEEVPGVQKIKAALRQTKRLLAKENLAADVRVTTERRLKSLEGDLARAERAKTERAMAVRYHKVKFFERQKILRKIARTKRTLENGVDAENEKLSKKKRKSLEAELTERRIDLNYILNYPKASKYISLFPPVSAQEGEDSDEEDTAQPQEQSAEQDVTSTQRRELREAIREAMNAEKLSQHPEDDLMDRTEGQSVHAVPTDKAELLKPARGKKGGKVDDSRAQGVDEDAFFEMNVD